MIYVAQMSCKRLQAKSMREEEGCLNNVGRRHLTRFNLWPCSLYNNIAGVGKHFHAGATLQCYYVAALR